MKNTTISMEKVAQAFCRSEGEFDEFLPMLHAIGFPKPRRNNDDFCATSVLEWLASQQEIHVALIETIKLRLTH